MNERRAPPRQPSPFHRTTIGGQYQKDLFQGIESVVQDVGEICEGEKGAGG